MSKVRIWIDEQVNVKGETEYYVNKGERCLAMTTQRDLAVMYYEAARSGYPKSKIIAETTVKE